MRYYFNIKQISFVLYTIRFIIVLKEDIMTGEIARVVQCNIARVYGVIINELQWQIGGICIASSVSKKT